MSKRMRIKRCEQVVFRAETQKTRRSKGVLCQDFSRIAVNADCSIAIALFFVLWHREELRF